MAGKIYKNKNFVRLFLIVFFILVSHVFCNPASAKSQKTNGYFAPILTFHHVAVLPANIDKVGKGLYVNPVYFEQVLIELKKNNFR